MSIYKYNDFLLEGDDEPRRQSLKEVPFIISDKLRNILKAINSPISKDILNDANFPDTPGTMRDISFVDYIDYNKDVNDKLTYLPAGKTPVGILSSDHINPAEAWLAKGRQEISVGKMVNKLFPGKYKDKELEVEKFVNDFKAEVGKKFGKFRLVDGEQIRYFYLDEHYESKNQGDINSSCMKGQKAQSYLDIYVNNPDKCKLLVLMSDKEPNKIKGRALVWMGTRKPLNRVYLDRIYTMNQADQKMFIDYAIENKWLYKAQQVMHDASYMEDGKRVHSSVSIALVPKMYKEYPSLDSLPYYIPSTGRLASNPGNFVPGHPRYQLNSAGGGSTKLDR